MRTAHVFSTLANDQLYTNYARGGGGENIPTHEILIKGGAGVANDRFVTPLGIATEIDEALLPALEQNPGFIAHRDAGYLSVRTKSANPEKVATDMNRTDKSAPLTPADYLTKGQVDDVKIGANSVN